MRRAALRRAELCAVDLLCEQGLTSIYDLAALDVRRLTLPVRVVFESFGGFCAQTGADRTHFAPRPHTTAEGLTLRRDGDYLILYDELTENFRRLNWTLAHELGHVMLGHTGEGGDVEEREAGAFAASLLCPAVALRYIEKRDGRMPRPEEITAFFPLSQEAAVYRLREMKKAPPPLADSEINLLLCLFGRIPTAKCERA